MNVHRTPIRRALVLSVLFAAMLGFARPAAAAYKAQVGANTLTLTGNGASDKLALRLGSPTILQVDVGDDGTADFAFDRTTFTGVRVEAGGGNDQIRVDQTNGAFTDEALVLDGGGGADTLLGGSGADILIGGDGDDFADGNQGSDVGFMGAGNDSFHWDPGDGNDIVEGQDGRDALDFAGANIAERVDVSANGGRVRFTRDVASITMDLDDVETVAFHALGGVDTVTVNDLAGTDVTTVDADLAANGGGGDGAADAVIVRGTDGPDRTAVGSAAGKTVVSGLAAQVRVSGAEAANDTVNVQTLAGIDTISTGAGAVSGLESLNIDGGDGVDTARFDGTSGADSIQVAPNGLEASTTAPGTSRVDTTTEHLVVSGLGGNDTLSASGNLAPLTALVLDGGNGADTLLGGNGNDILVGGNGADAVDGNQGSDLGLLGGGADSFHWDPGDGSDTVEGQSGEDVLDFAGANIAERIDVSANGGRVRFTRDIANITMDLDDTERIAFHALGGADQITVGDLAGTDAKAVDADLASAGAGDGAADTVIVNGTNDPDAVKVTRIGRQALVSGLAAKTRITGSEPANDLLRVQTLAGNDSVTVGPGLNELIQLLVDLGSDE